MKIEFSFEKVMFSPEYRRVVRLIKKSIKDDTKEGEKLDDIRTSEGAGKQGPASRTPSVSTRRYSRGNNRAESGQADNEAQNNSDTSTDLASIP
jgi:hypothetical protein